jgi:hypothetical protein
LHDPDRIGIRNGAGAADIDDGADDDATGRLDLVVEDSELAAGAKEVISISIRHLDDCESVRRRRQQQIKTRDRFLGAGI